jgi:hypothetical protein
MRIRSTVSIAIAVGLASVLVYAQAPVPQINLPLVPDAVAPGGAAFTRSSGRGPVATPSATRLARDYSQLPLSFEPNRGQAENAVKFLSYGAGYKLILTEDEATLHLRSAPSRSSRKRGAAPMTGAGVAGRRSALMPRRSAKSDPSSSIDRPPERSGSSEPKSTGRLPIPGEKASDRQQTTDSLLTFRLLGANHDAAVTGEDELPGKSNYFIGAEPGNWHTSIPNYSKVSYEQVYPGVDLVYHGNRGQLEFDFVVAPGADPNQIELELGAALAVASQAQALAARRRSPQKTHLKIDEGDLVLTVPDGEVRFHKPVIYQPAGTMAARATTSSPFAPYSASVEGNFVLKARNRVSFEIGSYDTTRPLVIDPALNYSTYIGGRNRDYACGIAVDTKGNAFLGGSSSPSGYDFCTSEIGQDYDVAVTKLNATGSALLYSTYLGGSDSSYGSAIALDSTGNAYVTGSTRSIDFPVTPGAYQGHFGGGVEDAFMAKLSPAGVLVYSTYVGGSDSERGQGIAVDSAGNAYVGGITASFDFPTTPGALQTTYGGPGFWDWDAFVTKLNPAGAALVYSTYLGGSAGAVGWALAVDAQGNAYITGDGPSGFPTTPGAFQTACGLGSLDAFVSKLNASGSALAYSTCIGGSSGWDWGVGIAVDAAGEAYVTGNTNSPDFPTTHGALQAKSGGGQDAFVAKLNPTGSALMYATFLGGGGYDQAGGIAVDSTGNAFVTGMTDSTDFPITLGAFQTQSNGSDDAFVSELNSGASALLYSTYLGGSGSDAGYAIAVDLADDIYVTGATASVNFPTTPGALQTSYGGGTGDAFLTKISGGGGSVELFPSTLNFGNQNVGSSSVSLTATLSNATSGVLTVAGISIAGDNSGDYSQTDNCGTSLAAGASCSLSVTFKPAALGPRNATLTVTDSDPSSPQTTSLTGVGTQPAVALSPTSITFPFQAINTSSAASPVTLTNTGNGALTITGMTVSGPFSQTNTCGSSVAPGAKCTINAAFLPKSEGTATGSVTITDNAPGSPQMIPLTGQGLGKPSLSAKIVSTSKNGTTLTATLQLTDGGTGAADNIQVTQITLQTLSGTGTVTLTSPRPPISAGNLAIGASTKVTLTLKVPSTVTKFSVTEKGTLQDIAGGSFSFAVAQVIWP